MRRGQGHDLCVVTIAAAACSAALLLTAPAAATYSIIAVDLERDEAGGAGTSCVGAQLSVSEIFGSAPGFGVVVAQAAINRSGRDRAVMLLAQGEAAPAVLAAITATSFDARVASRQYAVVDVNGMAAGFTGASNSTFAGDMQGKTGRYVYSVQGNILTGAAVIEQAAAEFDAPACDLADTLMRALEAGARNGQGDRRCTPEGIPSDSAFIQVDRAGAQAGSFLQLHVDDTGPNSPIVALRALYDAWRREHPCPAVTPTLDASVATDAAVVADAGMLDAASSDAAPRDAAQLDASPPDAATSSQAGAGGPPPIAGGPPMVDSGGLPTMTPSALAASPGVAGAAGAAAGSGGSPAPSHMDSAASNERGCGVVRPRRDGSWYATLFVATALLMSALRARRRRG